MLIKVNNTFSATNEVSTKYTEGLNIYKSSVRHLNGP